jgi:hypothetical protein
MLQRLIVTLALLLLCLPARAADPFPVNAMMSETALDQIFATYRAGMADTVNQTEASKDQRFISTWSEVANRMFAQDKLNAALSDELAQHPLSTQDQDALATFYRSPLGLKVASLDSASSQLGPTEADAAIAEGKALTGKLSAKRRAEFDELWTLTQGAARALSRQYAKAQIVATALWGLQGQTDDNFWPTIDAVTDKVMPTILPSVKQNQLWGNVYTYRDLTDGELASYIDFLRSSAGKHYDAVIGDALGAVADSELTRFGNAVADALTATRA